MSGQSGMKESAAPISIAVPRIEMPKGGGAVRGMGEKFTANPVNGTASMVVPIPTSPGRCGSAPELALSYDSGSGNGPFGIGWSLGLPAISRKTDKGLPRYDDAAESDEYVLAGAEDLVPVLDENGRRHADADSAPGFTIHHYKPRIEGLFSRIERWTADNTGEVHWRSISRDNVTTIYGRDDDSRIFDPTPGTPKRVFTWLICSVVEDRGAAVAYEYAHEDARGIDLGLASERNRSRGANRYLKRIRYGNRISHLLGEPLTTWLFEIVFDYDEGHCEDSDGSHLASSKPDRPWTVRPDPFSVYRSGFEIRTYRRCKRVLLFHCFPELGDHPYLVRTLEIDYADLDETDSADELLHQGSTRKASFIRSITQCGFVREGDPVLRGENVFFKYSKKALPALELEYSKPRLSHDARDVALDLPLEGAHFQWVDLDGEGLSGILGEQAGAWFYKPNLGGGQFGVAGALPSRPAASLAGGNATLLDLSGDGQLDVVSFAGVVPGFYERNDGGWDSLRGFQSLPALAWDDPNLRFIDLDGDGHLDILIANDHVFTWYPSLGEVGFGPARRMQQSHDEERGPRLVTSDGTQSIFLADLSGDGLTDLVRIRNGEVCYWPNLGGGTFGTRVVMDNSPWFDQPNELDLRRIRLADIDGSGTTDILYLHRDGVRAYFNQAGNRWSAPRLLPQVPTRDHGASVAVTDVLGNGTACLIWPTPNGGLRYIDLMGGQKPHLLVRANNGTGVETEIEYCASTKFYLADRRAGRPWLTRLPFPVHVIERVTVRDRFSGNRFAKRYVYHHGYFDGDERELRGFGMVEQYDTDVFAELGEGDTAWYVPPVVTKTWFHTGRYLGRDHVSDHHAGLLDPDDLGEYYREPGTVDEQVRSTLLPDTVLPLGLSLEEEREACRALKGSMLRQEVYALDGSAKAETPVSVLEQNFTIEVVQHRGPNRHAVFFVHPREVLEYQYERNPSDPRIAHSFTLEVDGFGNVLKSVAIAYGRKGTSPVLDEADHAAQGRLAITWTASQFTRNEVTELQRKAGHHRAPLLAERRVYELTGFVPDAGGRFSFEFWTRDNFARLLEAKELPYESEPDPTKPRRRLIEHVQTLYRKDDLRGLSAFGEVESQALRGETYKLALTPGLVAAVFAHDEEPRIADPRALLCARGADGGGYVERDGGWWIPSGRVYFHADGALADPADELAEARRHFFVDRAFVDAFGHSTVIHHDAHDLLVTTTVDAVQNTASAAYDYRVLQPHTVVDANRNRRMAAYDAIGMVCATAIMGKDGESVGDVLPEVRELALEELQAFVADPEAVAAVLLGTASTRLIYDIDRPRRADQPAFVATLARESHHGDGQHPSRIQISFAFSDGFGREIQRKAQAEPGLAPVREPPHALPSGDVRPGALVGGTSESTRRWVGSGRTVYNNKGKPVRQYEPFFSTTHLFEHELEITEHGVSPVLFYDPLERVVARLHPNGTYEKVIFDAWQQVSHDVNDTVTDDPRTDPSIRHIVANYVATLPASWETWHAARIGGQLGIDEQDASSKASQHAGTPTTSHLDPLGRVFVTVARSTADVQHATRTAFDIEGNQRAVTDAKGRLVMRYTYDLAGRRLHQNSMEAGERRTLFDVTDKPIRTWDSRGFVRRTTYDAQRRPLEVFVGDGGGERLARRIVYGEARGDALNHRGAVFQQYDGAGVVTHVEYDFKGNVRESQRAFLVDYKQSADWSNPIMPLAATHTTITAYDALNRVISVTSPDGSVYQPRFNEAGLLDRIDVALQGTLTPFVTNVRYNAKGQREQIEYANGSTTTHEYDPQSFRLRRLRTTRENVAASPLFATATVVQDLRYTYDPVGNITRAEDVAIAPVTHAGQVTTGLLDYTYDPIYRLIRANGREHIAQTGFDGDLVDRRDYPFVGHRPHTNDIQAFRNYREHYTYDEVGNLLALVHEFNGNRWTRTFEHGAPSTLNAADTNNRITRSAVGEATIDEKYSYDAHGNTTAMTGIELYWGYEDTLDKAVTSHGTTYYQYDSDGQRARQVVESRDGTARTERIYVGGVEIYRELAADGSIELERALLEVPDGKQRVALVETERIRDGKPVTKPSGLRRFTLGNQLGSVALELDSTGALITYEEYHPFGTSAFQAGRSATEVSNKLYRYTGKERDKETGFYYHGARYYVPWLARWLSPDPLFLRDSTNVYVYALDNPVVAKDPSGGPIVLVGVAVYLGYKALTSAGETAVEAGIAKVTGDEKFSAGQTFLKNMLVNSTLGLIPGTTEAKIGVKTAVFATKLAVRTTADATVDTMQDRGSFTDNLKTNAAGNLGGDLLGTLMKPLGKIFGKASKEAVAEPIAKEVVQEASEAVVEQSVKETAQTAGETAVEKGAQVTKRQVAVSPSPNTSKRPSLSAVMGDSANDAAGRTGMQWLHILARALGGKDIAENLVAGTKEANSVMLVFERMAIAMQKRGQAVAIDASVDMVGDTQVGKTLRYKMFVEVLDDAGKGTGVMALALDSTLDLLAKHEIPRGALQFFNKSFRIGTK